MLSILAFYLPQFHQIPENDEWWGEGFTEWTTVKRAQKLYNGHNQPKVPLNRNYYDLLKKETMEWQANLMKKYGIDGVCIYHYWFKKGRKILEKPAEKLLGWKDINMPYCFYWANQTWARSWSNVQKKNIWADLYETEEKIGNGVLLEQQYGGEEQWKKHFEYLIPFFRDKRYIKINNRPVFLIYKPSDIPCLVEMLEFWKELAKLHNIQEIYIIVSNYDTIEKKYIDAELYHEPSKTIADMPIEFKHFCNEVGTWEYDDIWNHILKCRPYQKTYFSGVVRYDDTPRRGKNGLEIVHSTPEKFSYYLTELLAKSEAYKNKFVFINAWNEWGEGMYLEPDEEVKEKYLEAILYAKKNYMKLVEKYIKDKDNFINKQHLEKINKFSESIDKNNFYLQLLDYWMTLRENKISLAKRLMASGYKKIAVYGYGILGKHLYNELLSGGIVIEYIIDQKKNDLSLEIPVYLPTEIFPNADIIVVSAVYDFYEIYKMLKIKGIPKIISLKTLLYEDELK